MYSIELSRAELIDLAVILEFRMEELEKEMWRFKGRDILIADEREFLYWLNELEYRQKQLNNVKNLLDKLERA